MSGSRYPSACVWILRTWTCCSLVAVLMMWQQRAWLLTACHGGHCVLHLAVQDGQACC
jgi:hypothetical protein